MNKFTFLLAIFIALLPLETSASSLTTEFNGSNRQAGNMFNIVIGPNPITIESFDLNFESDAGTELEVAYYIIEGGYQGFESSPSAWAGPITTSTVFTAGVNMPTAFDVEDLLFKKSTTYGIYLTTTGPTAMYYRNSNRGTEDNPFVSNDDLAINVGIGIAYPFGSTFRPRLWNGTINYSVSAIPLPAGLPLLGAGVGALALVTRFRKTIT